MQPTQNNTEYELAQSVLSLSATSDKLDTYEKIVAFFEANTEIPEAKHIAVANCAHDLRCRILNQFQYPEAAAVVEGAANALDAQRQARNLTHPLLLRIDKKRITIIDAGTGIVDLALFLIPSKTSNPRAIFCREEGEKKIYARFGQGVLSYFYFIAFHWREGQQATYVRDEKGDKTVTIFYTRENLAHSASFYKKRGGQLVGPECRSQIEEKKIIVSTCNSEGAYRLEFTERTGQIFFKVYPSKRKKIGTKIKIISPLLKSADNKIKRQVIERLQFINTPILVNGAPLYDLTLERLHLPGIEILYSPDLTDRVGQLFICEGGRTIQQFPLIKGILVPYVLALSFDLLPLSHERATIDWKDEVTLRTLYEGIEGIIHSLLPHETKIILLNSLAALFQKEKIDDRYLIARTISKVINEYVKQGFLILPDHRKVRTLGIHQALYFHPEYLDDLPLARPEKIILSHGKITLFSVDTANRLIVSVKKKRGTVDIFPCAAFSNR